MALTRCWTKLEKAASISFSLLAFRTGSLSPSACAAACMSLVCDSEAGFVGLVRNPTTVALGTSSCSSSRRFAASVVTRKLTPVALPPGRLKLETRPRSTGSVPMVKTIGMAEVAALAATAAGGATAMIKATGISHQLGCQCRQSVELTIGRAMFDCDIAAFDIAGFLQALSDSTEPSVILVGATEQADQRHRRLLRPRRYRPRSRAAEQREALPSLQLIELNAAVPSRAGLHDIELARISQVITERFYNLLAVGEGAHSPVGRERLENQGHRSFASARRPAAVIRMRVTSIRRPPATMRSMLVVANPALISSIRSSVLNP